MKKNDEILGVISVILAGIFWGTMSIFVRSLSEYGFNSLQIAMMRFLGGALFLALFVFVYDKKSFKINVKDIPFFALMGVFSCFCMGFFYFHSVLLIPISIATILMYTAPIWVLIVSVLFLGEKINAIKVIALILAFGGCICISGFSGGDVSVIGILSALFAGIAYASYSIFGKIITKKYGPLTVTLYAYLFAALTGLVICGVNSTVEIVSQSFDIKMLYLIIGLGIVTISIPFSLYTIGLSKIPAGKAAIISLTEPMVATIVGVALYNETFGIVGILGILMIVMAIVLLNKNN